jgi:hypothetical protein
MAEGPSRYLCTMRFRLLLLFLPLLLGACSKTNAPVRLDFVGALGLTSGSKKVAASDTLTTRVYAVGNDNALKRLRISVTYEPGLSPIIYPSPLSTYDPAKNAPANQEIVYLDTLLAPTYSNTTPNPPRGGEYLFVNHFTARSSSGVELWQYTATDTNNESASRAFRLTVRKPDSAAVYHSYTARLRAVPRRTTLRDSIARQATARVFLTLRYGLLLPKYAVTNQRDNQKLVDLIGVTDGTTFRLSTPLDIDVIKSSSVNWPAENRRTTELRRTTLTPTAFTAAVASTDFTAAFTAAGSSEFTPNKYTTGTLAKDQVVAFKVTEAGITYYGLLLVSDLVLGTSPLLTCSVKVQK